MVKEITELQLLKNIPDREEGKECPSAKEGDYHYIMYSEQTQSLKCGTCYMRAIVWADLHPDKIKIIKTVEEVKENGKEKRSS